MQSASFTPDAIVSAGLGADIPAQPAAGKVTANEVYGELRIPLLKDQPFFNSLEVNGAVRHSEYSIGGSSTTYTGTALWKPVADVLLRGSYSTGFRAPSLGELFGGRSRFDLGVTDPCTSDASGMFTTNATVRANCIANGVPAPTDPLHPTVGSYAEPPGQLPVITQGNLNLKPEKSRNITFGAVYSPAWARSGGSNLSLEVNYYDISVTNAIGAVDANLTIQNCALRADAASCALIVRTKNGFVNEIDGTLQNLDSIKTRGIDASFNYRTPETGIGRIGLNANATWLLKYVLSASNGFVVLDRKGTERGSPDQAFPAFKGNATIDWQLGAVNASFTGRYISGVTEIDPNTVLPHRLDSRFYGDIQLGFTPDFLDQRVALTVGVNNVFNRDPPACVSCSLNNFDPSTYDVPGQFGYLRLSYKM